MNILDHLCDDDRPAIIEPSGVTITFRDLRRAAERFGAGAAARLGSDERVLLLQPMGIPLYVVTAGLFSVGRTAVIVDPSAGVRRMRDAFARARLRGVIGPPMVQGLRLIAPELRGGALYASAGWCPFTERIRDVAGADTAVGALSPEALALITYTTGSTGRPKAVARTHGLLDAQHRALQGHMKLRPTDVDLATLPIFALNSLAAGATVAIADCDLRRPGAADATRILAQIARHGVTTISGSPAFFVRIVEGLEAQGAVLPQIRAAWTGGARVSAGLARRMCAAFPNATAEIVYGSTEAEPIATVDCRTDAQALAEGEADGRGALVGRSVPEIALRVVRPGTLDEADDVGEIIVSGAHVNPAYWEDPDADAAHKLRDGARIWHRTGDTGRRDSEGRIWLVGRVADVVEGLHPFPIEAAAERVAGIRRAALIDFGGALLCVEGDGNLDAVRVAAGVANVRRVARIPVDRRHNAKVDRAALRELLQ